MRAFVSQAGVPQGKYSVAFQSRLGRDPWMQPYTDKEIERRARGSETPARDLPGVRFGLPGDAGRDGDARARVLSPRWQRGLDVNPVPERTPGLD